jgi:hypothetical protein
MARVQCSVMCGVKLCMPPLRCVSIALLALTLTLTRVCVCVFALRCGVPCPNGPRRLVEPRRWRGSRSQHRLRPPVRLSPFVRYALRLVLRPRSALACQAHRHTSRDRLTALCLCVPCGWLAAQVAPACTSGCTTTARASASCARCRASLGTGSTALAPPVRGTRRE